MAKFNVLGEYGECYTGLLSIYKNSKVMAEAITLYQNNFRKQIEQANCLEMAYGITIESEKLVKQGYNLNARIVVNLDELELCRKDIAKSGETIWKTFEEHHAIILDKQESIAKKVCVAVENTLSTTVPAQEILTELKNIEREIKEFQEKHCAPSEIVLQETIKKLVKAHCETIQKIFEDIKKRDAKLFPVPKQVPWINVDMKYFKAQDLPRTLSECIQRLV